MSEHRWYVKQIWFGVEGPKPDLPMLGIIKRSGWCHQTGHFCHVKISVNGKQVWAGGAESRTFMIHLVTWDDIGHQIPRDMIPALGWGIDGNGYYCLHEGKVVEYGRGGTLHEVPEERWGKWKDDMRTLVERGAAVETPGGYNAYVALLEEPTGPEVWGKARTPRPRVTLPLGCFHTEAKEFRGLVGALSIWNGPPPPWCKQVVQVYQSGSFGGWIHVKDKELTILWEAT